MKRVSRLFLIVAVAGAVCLPNFLHAAGLREKGRAYFDFGVFAYEDGKYSEAESQFLKALELSPETPLFHQYLGKTYLKMARYEEAARHLNRAWAADPEMSGLRYDMGFLKFSTGDYAGAADLLTRVSREEPNNVLAHYYAGISLYKLERYADAADYFVKSADISPTVYPNGYYYAGICWFKSDSLSKSMDAFEKVLNHPDAGSLADSAEQWLAAVKHREQALRPYRVYVQLGLRYDDNVVLEPDDQDFFSDESDWATVFYFSGNYDFFSESGFKLGAGYSHYQTWYRDLDEYDLTGSIGSIYGEYGMSPFRFRLNYMPAYYWADNDSYLREHTIEPELFWRISPGLLTRLAYRYRDTDYFGDEGRSGHSNEVAADSYWAFFGGGLRLFGGLGCEDYSATDDDEYYERWRIQLGVLFALPWKLELGLNGQYQEKDYNNRDRFYGVEREDEKLIGTVSLSRPIVYDWLRILGEYRYTNNDSNINDFDYDRNVTTLSVTASY